MKHAAPSLGCRCRHCKSARLCLWDRLSDQKRKLLKALSFAVPRHQSDLPGRTSTRQALRTQGLIRLHYLISEDDPCKAAMPYFTLSQAGDELVRAGTADDARMQLAVVNGLKSSGAIPADYQPRMAR